VGLRCAVCVDGQNVCPPEDCGYAELFEVLADTNHEDHERLTTWVGGPFDPSAFDLAAVNAHLQHVR
jgi:Plasmid pRiA4b ORF-3-like protein